MTKLRCIAVAPKLSSELLVKEYRNTYDSLANFVLPHITLMFPFKSDISSDTLKQHVIQVCQTVKPFQISIGQAELSSDNLVALPVLEGASVLQLLNERLYAGTYSQFLNLNFSYRPHITIGRFTSRLAAESGLSEAKKIPAIQGMVSEIYCEVIAADESSLIEFSISLND